MTDFEARPHLPFWPGGKLIRETGPHSLAKLLDCHSVQGGREGGTGCPDPTGEAREVAECLCVQVPSACGPLPQFWTTFCAREL